ncbi:MAG: beta-N-acetylhexosaminidase [Bacilli bacterium]
MAFSVKPVFQQSLDGSLLINAHTTISYSQEFSEEINPLKTFWKNNWQSPIKEVLFGDINIIIDFQLTIEEYHILVTNKQVIVSAKTKQGMKYGIAALLNLIRQENNQFFIDCQEIRDYPAFSYRGFMLDVSRHFFPIRTIKKIMDAMFSLKLNVFHWHFSDDQGWRIESKLFPKLHEIGSISPNNEVGLDGSLAQQYYTQKEIKEILAYANERNIEIVPEMDIPGHSIAILAAYPHLSHHSTLQVKTTYGIADEIMCLGNEQLLPFLKSLIDEMVDLFKPNYFHLGSDEAKLLECEKCEHCIKVKNQLHLSSFSGLQAYLINELNDYLKTKKIQTIVWNDIAKEKINPNIIVQHWKPFTWKQTLAAQERGHQVLISPFFNYYLDYPYKMTSLKKVYDYNPFLMKRLKKENVLGLEAPLWTEWIAAEDKLFFHMFPRLMAFADSAWRGFTNKSYHVFVDNLPYSYKWLDDNNIYYAKFKEKDNCFISRLLGTIKWIKNKNGEYEKQKED